ncbi:MAG TPA: cbb3-type cytochrome c oxidase subunit I [Gaiellaceae bacterium]|nr:cbb3-type cytochrome c oxidase subunit I [Gaiellaceae bacterium]
MTKRLVARYLVASTVILFASGLLGILIRESQAGIATLHDNTWYALMTAHGLGAFLGWAGFAVMGLSFWVLEECGFELRRFGRAMADLTWWLMVLGVAGVLVSTIGLHFAGSWVFLYPLPFHSAGEWNDWATGIFSFSVLLAGLSIVTWCLSILDTVVGPALHAVRSNIFNRLGVALGLGYLWPKRFATNPSPVPYPVIPLTVIGIDMIIATLPLAVLLVEMIVQAFSPSVHVDPLLAKNILWFFGHPVVYLLLFPAVAVYYVLVPKLANRPLVAGNVIAVAWAIAVVANVVVWAHHIYIDYPDGTHQAQLNVLMQPTTFALVIPSALSLYSLGMTIWRSEWTWGVVETTLFLGLFSWLTAGLSGIVNATIAFDKVVHNTLWIVGHFHQMAIVNIGFVVFAGIYYLLPNYYGRPIWSDALAKWHIWLTFIGVTVNSGFWLWQGLNGAPRRFANLPSGYEASTRAALPFVALIAVAQILFAVNMVQTLRGAPKRKPVPWSIAAAEGAFMMLAIALALGAGIGGFFLGRATKSDRTPPAATTVARSPSAAGKTVFASAGCGGCHTLADAGSGGTVGPNLDQAHPSKALVIDRVTHGKGGMPSFNGRLSPAQIAAVAAYVSGTAH